MAGRRADAALISAACAFPSGEAVIDLAEALYHDGILEIAERQVAAAAESERSAVGGISREYGGDALGLRGVATLLRFPGDDLSIIGNSHRAAPTYSKRKAVARQQPC